MIESLLKRFLQSVVVVWLMSVLAFVGINYVGDPVYLLVPPDAASDEIERVRLELGLHLPVYEQYWRFLVKAVQGDLGVSFVFSQSALHLIVSRVPATLELAFTALLFSIVVGIPLGMVAGLRPVGRLHKAIMGFSIIGITMPTFWIGLLFILVFAVNLGWLPPSGRGPTEEILGVALSITSWEGIKYLILPAATLSLFKIALVIRLTESGTREVATQEYVKFARAKGVYGARLMLRHIAPNVMIPVVTAIGLELGHLIAFSVVTESIFAWPGMGKLMIDSILHLDRPVVVAYLMVTLLIFVLINFVVDVLYVVLDPRLRTKTAKA